MYILEIVKVKYFDTHKVRYHCLVLHMSQSYYHNADVSPPFVSKEDEEASTMSESPHLLPVQYNWVIVVVVV